MAERIKAVNESLFELGFTFEQIEAFWVDCITTARSKTKKSYKHNL